VSHGHRNGSPRPLISVYRTWIATYFIQVAPQLTSQGSRGWVHPVPDPMPLRKSGSAGNRTRDLCICSQKLWPLDHRGGRNTTVSIIILYYKIMGTPSYMRPVFDRNVAMRRIPVYATFIIILSFYTMVYNLCVWRSSVKYSVDSIMCPSHLFCITKYSPIFWSAFLLADSFI